VYAAEWATELWRKITLLTDQVMLGDAVASKLSTGAYGRRYVDVHSLAYSVHWAG